MNVNNSRRSTQRFIGDDPDRDSQVFLMLLNRRGTPTVRQVPAGASTEEAAPEGYYKTLQYHADRIFHKNDMNVVLPKIQSFDKATLKKVTGTSNLRREIETFNRLRLNRVEQPPARPIQLEDNIPASDSDATYLSSVSSPRSVHSHDTEHYDNRSTSSAGDWSEHDFALETGQADYV